MSKQEKRMRRAVESLQEYMSTYDKQHGYTQYSDKIFIDDVLYGLGLALDDKKYRFAQGYSDFKKVLIAHLTGSQQEPTK